MDRDKLWMAACFGFLAGAVFGIFLLRLSIYFIPHNQAAIAIKECEAQLSRHLECEAVITARVKP